MPYSIMYTDRNYLRVRGEYSCCLISDHDFKELPPRARRILKVENGQDDLEGTTSACAENTPQPVGGSGYCGNYLRVRGEYSNVP